MKSVNKVLGFLTVVNIVALIAVTITTFSVFNNKSNSASKSSDYPPEFINAINNGFVGTYEEWLNTTSDKNDGSVEIDDNKDNVSSSNNANTTSYSDWVIYENQRVYSEIVRRSRGVENGIKNKKTNILFFTDSHIDYVKPEASYQNALLTFDFAYNSPIAFDAIINGGDTITPFGRNSKEKEKENISRFFNKAKESPYPVVYCKGNHDLNDWDNTPDNVFHDTDWSDLFYDFAEKKYGIVRQTKKNEKKSTWHYYDIDESRIRIICIDVQDTDKSKTDSSGNVFYHGGVSWYVSQEQMSWIVETALNFDDKENKDWGVIVVSHQSRGYGDFTKESPLYENALEKLHKVLVAFNDHKKYASTYTFATNHFFDLTIDADFSRYKNLKEKPKIICWLVGHEHYDQYENQNGINVIWTTCGECCDSGMPDIPRIQNSITQNSFDILSIDSVKREISIIRYGAGDSRFLNGEVKF